MGNSSTTPNLELIHSSVRRTNRAVVPPSGNGSGADKKSVYEEAAASPYDQAVAKAVQSIAQSTAIAIQDGADMMRNVSIVEVTAIGTATAKWIAEPLNVAYKEIINNSLETIEKSAEAYQKIGEAAYAVLEQFDVWSN